MCCILLVIYNNYVLIRDEKESRKKQARLNKHSIPKAVTFPKKNELPHVHVLMRDEKEGRKKQARSNKQTNKVKQHNTPKAVTFPKKNELPHVHVCAESSPAHNLSVCVICVKVTQCTECCIYTCSWVL